MKEAELFAGARLQLAKADNNALSKLRAKLFNGPAELSWVNKAVESAVLVEQFGRTGLIDVALLSRVIYTAESLEIFEELTPIRQNPFKPPSEQAPLNSCRVLFLSSKFGNYVSSQEYVGSVLPALGSEVTPVLASRKPIAQDYSSRFEAHRIENVGELRKVCKESKIDKVVDLSTDNYDLIRLICSEVHVANVWGDVGSGLLASSTLAWPENDKYAKFHYRPVPVSDAAIMFLPPQGTIRNYPEIATSAAQSVRDGIVFGAFCRTAKLNLKVIRIWCDIMSSYPDSTITFAFIQSNTNSEEFVRAIFEKFSISRKRVSFLARMDTRTYLDFLNSIDINLGAMPEQGGISCMDSILMGCPYPVCEELSNTYVSSIAMRALGLDDWIAHSADDYRNLIDRLIRELAITRGKEFRESIRAKLLHSPLSKADNVASTWNRFLRTAV